MSQADFALLEESVQKKLEAKRNGLLKKLQATYEKVQELGRQTAEKLQNTDKAVANFTVSRLFSSLIQEYKALLCPSRGQKRSLYLMA